jgi:hypothetical protein
LRVSDFADERAANDEAQLESFLTRRYGDGVNAFWLSHDDGEFPTLLILVKADIAYLHYIPGEGHAGFSSVGGIAEMTRGGLTTFPISFAGDDLDILNAAVVPTSTALNVAKDFFLSRELPRSIEWFEL